MKLQLHKISFLASVMLLLLPCTAGAQFFTNGDDPFGRWYSIESPNYKIIYPKGLDSLARVYARTMEQYRMPVSLTAGFLPGQGMKGKMPVVLHGYNAVSNGSVAWAPKRMDAYTIPEVYGSEAHPWTDQLAVHESRHISQMQFGLSYAWKPFKYIFGEMFNGLSVGLLTEKSFLEGDAVIAETELTKAGRGRSADFLNYYMTCFDQGDLRDWDRWRYGSQKYYTPNHYAIGYLTYGGIRWYYDSDDFTARYLDKAAHKPYMLWVREVIAKETGGLNVTESFKVVADSLAKAWSAEADKRAPYMPMERVSTEPRKHADYTDLFTVGDGLYCLKSGLNDSRILVRMETDGEEMGREQFITRFATQTGQLHYSNAKDEIIWSESIADARWSLKYTSNLRRMKPGESRKRSITRKQWMYNPVFSPDGEQIAAVEIIPAGGSRLVIADESTGKTEYCFPAPDSLQLVEPIWTDSGIYVTGISENGYGIYRLSDGTTADSDNAVASPDNTTPGEPTATAASWEMLLGPQPVKIHNLRLHDGQIQFTSDHNGVNELYSLDTNDGEVLQLTSTRYGAADFEYSQDGQWLYYSSQTIKGKTVYRTPVSELTRRHVVWTERPHWIIADKLSEQAERRAEKLYGDKDYTAAAKAYADSVTLTEPKRWHKLPHLMHFHSWAPFYFNVPKIMNFSGEKLTDYISLGATALFQNNLGTADGSVGYSAHRNPDENNRWIHSGHFYLRYSGLYPVIEAEVNVGERTARQYGLKALQFEHLPEKNAGYYIQQFGRRMNGKPYTEAKVTVSVPWNLSSGGWYRQLKPSISYTFTNDRYDTRIQMFYDKGTGRFLDGDKMETGYRGDVCDSFGAGQTTGNGMRPFAFTQKGRNIYRQNIRASLLYYSLLPVTSSGEYPRWGFGVETGIFSGLYHKTAGSYGKEYGYTDIFSPLYFARVFGYTPGFTREQGLKLSLLWQHRVNPDAFFGQSLSILPRGFESKYPLNSIGGHQSNMLKISADYAVPIYVGDRGILGGCIFIKRLLMIPYIDCTLYDRGEFAATLGGAAAAQSAGLRTSGCGCFLSYGTQFMLDMTNVLWLSLPMRLGIDFSLNGAPGFKEMNGIASLSGTKIRKYFIGPVFNLSF